MSLLSKGYTMVRTACVLTLCFLAAGGCGSNGDAEVPAKDDAVESVERQVEEVEVGALPDWVPEELLDLYDNNELFVDVPFSWNNPTPVWDYMDQQQRLSYTGLDTPLVRITYDSLNARIIETGYGPNEFRTRYQEEFRNGEWISHGPCLYCLKGGDSWDISFFVDGEPHGTRVHYDSNGSVTWTQEFDHGIWLTPSE